MELKYNRNIEKKKNSLKIYGPQNAEAVNLMWLIIEVLQ